MVIHSYIVAYVEQTSANRVELLYQRVSRQQFKNYWIIHKILIQIKLLLENLEYIQFKARL